MVVKPKPTTLLLNVKSDIIDYVMDKAQETLETMIEYTIYQYKRKFGDIDEYEKEWIRLHLEKELTAAFEVWTKSTDTLIDFNVGGNVNSIITFACVIRRNNQNYMFNTNILWTALRYRNSYFNYLTKTTIEHTKRREVSKRYDRRILKLVERKNLENKIYLTELNMNRIRCNILLSESKSDKEIVKSQKKDWHDIQALSWKQACDLGMSIFYLDENDFYLAKRCAVRYALNNYKDTRIIQPQSKVKALEQELKLLKDKYQGYK